MKEIVYFKLPNGKEPFQEWKKCLDDVTAARIEVRLLRIRDKGVYGDYHSVGNGVYELSSVGRL